jgi:hypothetical protein
MKSPNQKHSTATGSTAHSLVKTRRKSTSNQTAARSKAAPAAVKIPTNRQEKITVSVNFPIAPNGTVKLVLTQPSQKSEDASVIAAIARGTCWFEELTSGKASSISGIATRENVTDSYISRLLNLALLPPTIVHQVLGCEGQLHIERLSR